MVGRSQLRRPRPDGRVVRGVVDIQSRLKNPRAEANRLAHAEIELIQAWVPDVAARCHCHGLAPLRQRNGVVTHRHGRELRKSALMLIRTTERYPIRQLVET